MIASPEINININKDNVTTVVDFENPHNHFSESETRIKHAHRSQPHHDETRSEPYSRSRNQNPACSRACENPRLLSLIG
jgi:hypothetical protein